MCARCVPNARLISAKIRWILPKTIKESVDLPDFIKKSVPDLQILCTFQATYKGLRLTCSEFNGAFLIHSTI